MSLVLDPERSLLDATNAYAASSTPVPYFTMPSWFRRFLFQVVSPRELSIYVYLCCLFNKNGIAFPHTEQIMADLGLKKRETVTEAVENLVELGFLLKERRRVRLGRAVERIVYQRPATEYTLVTLLQAGTIDESLYPTDNGATRSLSSTSETAVVAGLTSLVGDRASVLAWSNAEDESEKAELLLSMLSASLRRKRGRELRL